MTLGTHVAFATVLGLGGATRFGYKPDGISGALAVGASGLPDMARPPPGWAGGSGSSPCPWNTASALAP